MRLSQLVADFNSSWVQISGDPFFRYLILELGIPFFFSTPLVTGGISVLLLLLRVRERERDSFVGVIV